MELEATEVSGVTKVVLTGRLDTAGVSKIEARFSAAIVPLAKPAVIDLSAVTFLASLGVRMLISTSRALSWKGAKLALYGATPAVMEIIETTLLHEIVPVAETEADALQLVKA